MYRRLSKYLDKLTTWIGDKLETFGTWGTENYEILSTGLHVALMIIVLIIIACYVLGFILNGFFGYKFELSTVWQGVTAVVTGIATLFNMNKNYLDKYKIDSELNSESGKAPDFLKGRGRGR